jgi:hypothetical protein
MIRICLILTFSLFVYLGLNAQKWTFKKTGNAFDGEYKVAMVGGSGGEFPYTSPTFYINYFQKDFLFNIYIGGAGYAGCDNKIIYVTFDKNTEIYEYSVSTDTENETWFFDFNSTNEVKLLLEMMKKNSIMNIRVKSDCGQSDYKFSLSGSTSAIDFVSKEYLKSINENEKIQIEQNRIDSINLVIKK